MAMVFLMEEEIELERDLELEVEEDEELYFAAVICPVMTAEEG
jgi:hypothetical protein